MEYEVECEHSSRTGAQPCDKTSFCRHAIARDRGSRSLHAPEEYLTGAYDSSTRSPMRAAVREAVRRRKTQLISQQHQQIDDRTGQGTTRYRSLIRGVACSTGRRWQQVSKYSHPSFSGHKEGAGGNRRSSKVPRQR